MNTAPELAQKLPQSTVLKAFNTTLAGTLSSGTAGGAVPATVLVAGDDDGAKQAFIEAGVRVTGNLPARMVSAGPAPVR